MTGVQTCALPISQFANHLRAVLDWPLGPTDLLAPVVVMANLLGEDRESMAPRMARALDVPQSAVQVAAGATSREKLIRISGDPSALSDRLGAL